MSCALRLLSFNKAAALSNHLSMRIGMWQIDKDDVLWWIILFLIFKSVDLKFVVGKCHFIRPCSTDLLVFFLIK